MSALLSNLSSFLPWLFRSSWQTAVVVCLVLAIQAIFGKRISPAWRYALWFLVVVRLLLPFAVESRLSLFNVGQTPAVQNVLQRHLLLDRVTQSSVDLTPPAPDLVDDPPPITVAGAVVDATDASDPISPVVHNLNVVASWSWLTIAAVVWATGAALLLARLLYGSLRFSSRVCRRRPVTDKVIMDLFQDCKSTMNVHVPMDVVETPRVRSPALLGFIRPRLLLPEGMLESFDLDSVRYFFLHELAHFKRFDIVINWLVSFLHVMHWFNPLVWIAVGRMRIERELACDARVMQTCKDVGDNKRYGKAIVDLLSYSAKTQWLPGVVGVLEEKKHINRRIAMIAQPKTYTMWSSVLAASLMLAIAAVSLTDARAQLEAEKMASAAPNAVELEDNEVEVTGHIILINSEAVPRVEEQLAMDLDSVTGRSVLTESEAMDLLDALQAEDSAHLVGEGSAVISSGQESAVKATQDMYFKTHDDGEDICRQIGSILFFKPTIDREGNTVQLDMWPEVTDLLATRKMKQGDMPLFESLQMKTRLSLPNGAYLLLHGSRSGLREFHNVSYADSLNAQLKDSKLDFFILISARSSQPVASPSKTAREQLLLTCRFIDLGPTTRRKVQAITGARSLAKPLVVSKEDYSKIMEAIERGTDAHVLGSVPFAVESGAEATTKWVQEVIFHTGRRFETRETGLMFNGIPAIHGSDNTIAISPRMYLVYPPATTATGGMFSPLSVDPGLNNLKLEPGQTYLVSAANGGGIVKSNHKCIVALTARRLGDLSCMSE